MAVAPEKIQVLHVDDEPDFAELAAKFVQRYDERLDVETATSAEDALIRLGEAHFHCIVSDYDMPGRTGIEFLEAVREEHPDLPFILYTGKGSEEIASDAISAGVTDYLQKGRDSSQYEILAQRINNAVQGTLAERELQQTLSRVTDAIFTVDSEWRITYVNEGAEEIIGPEEELLGENLWEQFPEAAEGIIWQKLHAAMETQEPKSYEVFYEPLELWADATAYPSETGVTVYFQDITDQKQRERELERMRDFFKEAERLGDLGAWEFDASGDVVWTDGTRRIHEVDEDFEPTIESGIEFYHPDDRDRIREAVENALENGTQYDVQARIITGEDNERWIRTRGKPLDDGELIRGYIQDITEQKRREQELGDLAEYNREIVENAPVGLFRLDDQMRITYENERAEEIIGVPEGEDESPALGTDIRDLPPVQETDIVEALNRLAAGESVTFDTPFESIFGKETYLSGKGIPLYDNGDFNGAIIMVIDITEQKEREQRYNAIFNQTYQFTGLLEPDGTLIEANQTALDFGGLDRDEVVGKKMWEAHWFQHSEETTERAREAVEQAANGEFVRRELPVQGADGAEVIIDFSVRPVTDEDGNVVLLVPEGRDITDLKRREEELRRERDRFQMAFDTVPEPAVHVEFDATVPIVQRINEAFSETFGYSQEEAKGQSVDALIVPGDRRDDAADINQKVLEAGRVEEEIVRQTTDGEKPFLFTAKTMAVGQEGPELVEGIATYVDLTELKRRERELTRQNERLEQFASMVSHDLRSPLRVAEGNLELAIEDEDLEPLDSVADALTRMDTIIEDMLSLASAGDTVGETESVELDTLADTCWSNVETASAAFDIETSATIQADKSRLQQLLENLLRNAIEHGGDEVTITIGDLTNGFYVEDDGPGIAAKQQDAVLEPGYSTREGGTGFGLNIVREIAEAHGWKISVTEGSNGGARFELTGVEKE